MFMGSRVSPKHLTRIVARVGVQRNVHPVASHWMGSVKTTFLMCFLGGRSILLMLWRKIL